MFVNNNNLRLLELQSNRYKYKYNQPCSLFSVNVNK